MSRWNDCTYYIIPKDELNEDIISVFAGSPDNVDSLRYSIRLVSPELIYKIPNNKTPKFCCVGDLHPNHPKSRAFQDYRPYTHEEIYYMVRTADWDIGKLFNEVIQKYDFDKVINDFQKGYLLQAIGELHIVVYNLLKTMFFLFSKDFLKAQDKWKLFQGSPTLERANESTILQLNYFYDLISKYEKDQLEIFRNIRNDIVHDRNRHIENHDLEEVLQTVNDIILKYFIKHSSIDESFLHKKLNYSTVPNFTLIATFKKFIKSTNNNDLEFLDVPDDIIWVDIITLRSKIRTHYRIFYISLVPYDFVPTIDFGNILGKMSKGDKNVILFAGNDLRSMNYTAQNLKNTDKFKDYNLQKNGFRVDSVAFNTSGSKVLSYHENIVT